MPGKKKRWVHAENVLRHIDGGTELIHPTKIASSSWIDDMKSWPCVEYKNIFNYFVLSEGIDGERMENYKSMESFDYFQSSKVGTVFYHEPAAGLCYLKAEVTPGQASKASKHSAWVLTTSAGVVETAGCTCIAGKGRTCSHSASILWKVEYAYTTGRSGVACTDIQQGWNKGTMRNIDARRLENISFKKRRLHVQLNGDNEVEELPDQPKFLSHEDFVKYSAESSVGRLFQLKGSLIGKAFSSTPHVVRPHVRVHGEHSKDGVTCELCRQFYEKLVNIDGTLRTVLEQNTKEQSQSDVWRDARKVRITGSTAKKVPVRATTNPENFLREQLYPSFRGNYATEHGRLSEVKALQTLCTLGYNIEPQGTVVHSAEPWLSASPDGITECGCVVEVKCPLHEGTLDGVEVCDVSYIEGKPKLTAKGARGYYMQVQITMFCTGLQKCLFFVWNEKSHVLIHVDFDEAYTQDIVLRLKQFYFEKMLPRLADDFRDGRLKLSKSYKDMLALD